MNRDHWSGTELVEKDEPQFTPVERVTRLRKMLNRQALPDRYNIPEALNGLSPENLKHLDRHLARGHNQIVINWLVGCGAL